jgi:hypothetical protein
MHMLRAIPLKLRGILMRLMKPMAIATGRSAGG